MKHFLSSRLIRIIGIAVLSGSLVLATPSKLAPELSTEAAGSNVKVIIQFKQAPLAVHWAVGRYRLIHSRRCECIDRDIAEIGTAVAGEQS